jgi:hypothetical protein
MIRVFGVAAVALAVGVAALSTVSARSADQLPPLVVTAQDLGPAFTMAYEGAGLAEPNSFRRVLQQTDMGFSSVSVVLYSETAVTPRDALAQVMQSLLNSPAGAGLTEEAMTDPQGYGADTAGMTLGGMVGSQQIKAVVISWRSGDVVAVVTATAAVAAPESAEQVTTRLRGYIDAQRDKLTAMGLPLATTSSAPATAGIGPAPAQP